MATTTASQPPITIQCPYTASNCPLFNPVFNDADLLPSAHPSPAAPSNGAAKSPQPSAATTALSYAEYSLAPTPFDLNAAAARPQPTTRTSYDSRGSSTPSGCAGSCGGGARLGSATATDDGETAAARHERSRSTERDVEDLLGFYLPSETFPPAPPTHSYHPSSSTSAANPTTSVSPPSPPLHDALSPSGSHSHSEEGGDDSYSPPGLNDHHAYDRNATGVPDVVTPFISKLSHLLSHPDYAEVIRWNDDGNAFIFAHTSPILLDVFSRFFRHANVHSFVRQLNIYGFIRLSTLSLLTAIDNSPAPSASTQSSSTAYNSYGLPQPPPPSSSTLSASDYSGFSHPLFWRDGPGNHCDLAKIKPKVTAKKSRAGAGAERKRKAGEGAEVGT
ncbi:hypothetical protein MNV49_005382 [Pseudohyphozyma bogoriensis]|nr:hypothetical protein MNV49_005382 [Pseudohyphozyma bogoriensis]